MRSLLGSVGRGRAGRRHLALAVVLGALAAGTAVGLTGTSAWLIARASQQPPVLHLMVAIVAVRAFGIGRGVLRYAERVAAHDATLRRVGDLRADLVDQLQQVIPLGQDDGRAMTQGALLARFADDTERLQDSWVRLVLPAASALLVGSATVAFVAWLLPSGAVVLLVSLLGAALVAPAIAALRARRAAMTLAPQQADYGESLLDLLDGASELTVYGVVDERLGALERADRKLAGTEARLAATAGWGAAVATMSAGVATLGCLWLAVAAAADGRLDPVLVAVVALIPAAVHEVFATLPAAGTDLPAVAGAAVRIRQLFTLAPAVHPPATPVPAPPGLLGLRIRDLTVRWEAGGRAVLAGASLDLPAGSVTIITGPSGAGKSTLAATLLRLVQPDAGSIEVLGTGVDGACVVALEAIDPDASRALFGWCAQDADIFDSTIEANVRLANPAASVADIAGALDLAGLGSWIAQLPDGLQTMVGEHGRQLSGGQRQRLALARALLRRRPIMLFDEPTEHLDPATAASLATDLLAASRGSTVVVITHSPELFAHAADRVVELRDGTFSVRE